MALDGFGQFVVLGFAPFEDAAYGHYGEADKGAFFQFTGGAEGDLFFIAVFVVCGQGVGISQSAVALEVYHSFIGI